MWTKITSISELKALLVELLLNKTDKISKVSEGSVNNAIAFANSKISQKALKDIAIVESQLFPEYASGDVLEVSAKRASIPLRLGSSASSTYLYLYGEPGTKYYKGTHRFQSIGGISFDLDKDVIIPSHRFVYAKVRSSSAGSSTNVDPWTITQVTPIPSGHEYVTNPFLALGGRDSEDDQMLLYRIQSARNLLSLKTLDFLTQILLKYNSDILKVSYQGKSSTGKTILSVATQNGIDLTELELSNLLTQIQDYLCISDLRLSSLAKPGIILQNYVYQPIHIQFRADIGNSDPDQVYRSIQLKFSKYVDFRFWDSSKIINWSDLLMLVKETDGVIYVPTNTFYLNGGTDDIQIGFGKLPRFCSFVMYPLDGDNIIRNTSAEPDQDYFQPIFYPVEINPFIQQVF